MAVSSGRLWMLIHRRWQGVHLEPGVRVVGWPVLRLPKGAHLWVGANTLLNSSGLSYHAMHGPVTIIAASSACEIRIGADCRLHGTVLNVGSDLSIGRRTLIAAQTTILDSNGHVVSPPTARTTTRDVPRPILIGEDVWIGMGAVVLPGTSIGDGSVTGANCVVSGAVPRRSIVRTEHAVTDLLSSAAPDGHPQVLEDEEHAGTTEIPG